MDRGDIALERDDMARVQVRRGRLMIEAMLSQESGPLNPVLEYGINYVRAPSYSGTVRSDEGFYVYTGTNIWTILVITLNAPNGEWDQVTGVRYGQAAVSLLVDRTQASVSQSIWAIKASEDNETLFIDTTNVSTGGAISYTKYRLTVSGENLNILSTNSSGGSTDGSTPSFTLDGGDNGALLLSSYGLFAETGDISHTVDGVALSTDIDMAVFGGKAASSHTVTEKKTLTISESGGRLTIGVVFGTEGEVV